MSVTRITKKCKRLARELGVVLLLLGCGYALLALMGAVLKGFGVG